MKVVTLSKLRACLSECLARVKQGDEVLVTERGKPIARIIPVTDSDAADLHREDLIRQGIIRPGKGSVNLEMLRSLPKTRLPDDVLIRIMEEEREDRV